MKEKIESMKAPAAIGPYSQAVNNGGLVFVSGQLPIDCATGEFVSDDVSDQTRQSLENIKSILAEVGYGTDFKNNCIPSRYERFFGNESGL